MQISRLFSNDFYFCHYNFNLNSYCLCDEFLTLKCTGVTANHKISYPLGKILNFTNLKL